MRWIPGGNGSYLREGQLWGRGGVVGSVGCVLRKACMLNRERESAMKLSEPGMCCADTVKL